MELVDYNGEGKWTHRAVLARYAQYAAASGATPRDLSPDETSDTIRRWIHPVMHKVIEGIADGDPACVQLGIEFIEEDAKFPFGKTLKANTARALRHASLTNCQKQRIRQRVFGMLRVGKVPREFREYARLVRRIGFVASDVPTVDGSNPYAVRFRSYFDQTIKERTYSKTR
jgi:hypothetical protein